MFKFIKTIVINSISLYLTYLLLKNDGMYLSGVGAAIVAGLVFSIMNITIKPLLKIITFPITILTFGLFTLVVNGITLWATSYLVDGLKFANFTSAIIAFIILSIINWIIGTLDKDKH